MTQSSPNSLYTDTDARSLPCCPMARPSTVGGPFSGREEPALPELMDDPVLRRMMASDGVRPDTLMALIADTRLRLAAG